MAIDMIEQNESARFDENDSEQASLNGLENSFFSSSADYSSNDNGESNGTNGQSTNKQTPSLEYLQQLLKDKTQLVAFPNIFAHVNKLVDEEISRVRNALFQYKSEFAKEALKLPEPVGEIMTREEKVFVPVREHPDFNFVGRILGPRGMTAKQFEQETGCKIMVRGKGSMRDKKKEELNRGKPNWEHLNEDLHVLIHCEDTANRIESKIARAIDEVKKLLTPSLEGDDELKKKQLMELALINGTYRNGNSTPNSSTSSSTVSKNSSMLHSNPLSQCMKTNGLANLTGAPLILPTPSMSGRTSLSNSSTLPCLTNHIPGANTIPLSTLSALQQPNLNPASNPYLSSLIGLHNTNVPVDYQLLLGQVQQSLDANTQLQFIQQQQQQLALAAMIQAQSATGVGGLIGDYSTTLNTYGIPAFDPSNSGPISSQKKYQQQNRDHPYSTRKEALKKELH